MDKKIKVAVMGATGAVGQVFMWMLADHPWFELAYATASASRVGLKYASTVHWVMPFEMPKNVRDVEVKEFNMEAMKEAGVKIVFSALPAEVAREAEPQLRDNGFYVFSNAASMRYESNVPILIPETNVEQLDLIKDQGYPDKGFVVTNANCVTTGLAMALAPLRKYGIKNIMLHSYQSVSGAGYPGLSSFDITDNCIPFIKGEEEKIEKEIKKILTINPEVYCYTVRVPVMFGHLEAVWLDLEQDVEVEDIIADWASFKEVSDLPSTPELPVEYGSDNTFPQPKYAFWGNPSGMVVYTGRLKKKNNKIGFLLLVNNIVKGAAGGSIQNAEAFVKRFGLI
ncbi:MULTISPECIES: aspartate-semialdehyde dehydrogenase [Sphaerochaeta]|jgi:aspartate-semialdehyde dehydrogenase|nr:MULTISPECIES: aspartate-semialdehyde dehydrogenase [Sphaerochaeta]MDT3359434.1 aspartate-semialdehyde dehydrogenase [Spirochaetota bacterium]MDD2394139.1 aspartate-semialdehyde dehydrogenase [Sphaerochaeta sp.]MDD3424176.1 aspartate-semialdehyde dehydrogenase [Sphaerochaeta sp.]MDD3456760.1 aspartate-semialdehyde dehydrogenase [Sphaerochaeta sp.]MDD4037710.1 aspartate-semialdehyde dehydrogenase [Sphaerochaeta sp.]